MTTITQHLANFIKINNKLIDEWFENEYSKYPPCFYSSVDLRNSGRKLVPIDTNLFPAGFNNFDKNSLNNASKYTLDLIKKNFPLVRKILIIPENHTRNLFYLDSLHNLESIIKNAGFDTRFGIFDLDKDIELISHSGHKIEISTISKKLDKYMLSNGFIPDMIILNNDMSCGNYHTLEEAKIPILPSISAGWHTRTKSNHFSAYRQLIEKFCKEFQLDPFLISADFRKCGKINFKQKKGIECIALNVDKLIYSLREKYKDYSIDDEPYVFIKADKGTYGMGIMTASNSDEIYEMNKKVRNQMDSLKSGVSNSEVVIQEGIKTIDYVDNKIAEPLIYLMDCKTFGLTYRVHENKNEFNNLNSKGMYFKMMDSNNFSSDFTSYFLVARLASLASCIE